MIITEKSGEFYDVDVSYEVIGFGPVVGGYFTQTDCMIKLKCLTSAPGSLFFIKPRVEGEEEKRRWGVDEVEELLLLGTLKVSSPLHTEEWFRPDMQCGAV